MSLIGGNFRNKFFGPPVQRASFLRVEWEKFCPFKKKVSIPICTTVLWENVAFTDEKDVVIFIPYSKTTGFKGKFIDIYPIKGNWICPSASLYKLRRMAESEGIWSKDKPVFSFKSGKYLTKAKLNSWLATLLSDFTDSQNSITGHSFRAAIPSLLAANPDISSTMDIQLWGGWTSESFKLYTKNEREKKKIVFKKIVTCLMISA